MIHPQPKPEKRRTTKGRKDRAESKEAQRVRALCVMRDGDCRYATAHPWQYSCHGDSEWAHYGQHKRARTGGMKPAERHSTKGSLMLCTRHHADYDAGRLQIIAETADGCDGTLKYVLKG